VPSDQGFEPVINTQQNLITEVITEEMVVSIEAELAASSSGEPEAIARQTASIVPTEAEPISDQAAKAIAPTPATVAPSPAAVALTPEEAKQLSQVFAELEAGILWKEEELSNTEMVRRIVALKKRVGERLYFAAIAKLNEEDRATLERLRRNR
jgi:hypothetical protein